jgi:hypothetical protein
VVPVGVLALAGDDGSGGPPVAGNPDASDVDPVGVGRWESWHGLKVLVPEDWQYGDQATWCAGGRSADQALVTRPGGLQPSIACTPQSSYGVSFQDIDMKESDEPFDWPVVRQTGDAWPAQTFVGAHGEDGVLVTVAGPDREQVVSVLETVGSFGDTDPNGCSRGVDDGFALARQGAMSVCRYDTSGRLEQSELLFGGDATAAAEALDHMQQGELDCAPAEGPGQVIKMFDGVRDVTIELDGACTVGAGTPSGIVDPDVLWWALSPGFSGDTTGLATGNVLRSYDPLA